VNKDEYYLLFLYFNWFLMAAMAQWLKRCTFTQRTCRIRVPLSPVLLSVSAWWREQRHPANIEKFRFTLKHTRPRRRNEGMHDVKSPHILIISFCDLNTLDNLTVQIFLAVP